MGRGRRLSGTPGALKANVHAGPQVTHLSSCRIVTTHSTPSSWLGLGGCYGC